MRGLFSGNFFDPLGTEIEDGKDEDDGLSEAQSPGDYALHLAKRGVVEDHVEFSGDVLIIEEIDVLFVDHVEVVRPENLYHLAVHPMEGAPNSSLWLDFESAYQLVDGPEWCLIIIGFEKVMAHFLSTSHLKNPFSKKKAIK